MIQYHLVLKAALQIQNNWYSAQLHCDYFCSCAKDKLWMRQPSHLFLAKPYSLASQVLERWELELMHVKVGVIFTKQFNTLSQIQSHLPRTGKHDITLFLQL